MYEGLETTNDISELGLVFEDERNVKVDSDVRVPGSCVM